MSKKLAFPLTPFAGLANLRPYLSMAEVNIIVP
uniref:Uncharacterized protein n=1 Tax=Rhizophora mucronata TaxID=61149 RepID=A0A2P2N0E3_RHIMU